VLRESEVCSSVMVTLALGITPPDASLTSPEMPPSVCCANRGEQHSAATVAIASSRESREEKICMEYLKWRASKNGVFPIGFLICQKTLGARCVLNVSKSRETTELYELISFSVWYGPF